MSSMIPAQVQSICDNRANYSISNTTHCEDNNKHDSVMSSNLEFVALDITGPHGQIEVLEPIRFTVH